MDEFEVISQFLAPLSKTEPGAFNLSDDAAVLDGHLVLTKDLLVAGVHFPHDASPKEIAGRALGVNLSDIAAMGARPRGYLLGCAVPDDLGPPWWKKFCGQLGVENRRYGISLLGGDQVGTPGPLLISVTMLGEATNGQVLRRNGARLDDQIWVSGTVGDSAAGLRIVTGDLDMVRGPERDFLVNRYRVPQPRVELGQSLVGLVHSALDVSDGLAADLEHICEQSGVGARVEIDSLPISGALNRLLKCGLFRWDEVVSGGDDYELLCTAPPAVSNSLSDLGMTCIGRIVRGSSADFLDSEGQLLPLTRRGYRHGADQTSRKSPRD